MEPFLVQSPQQISNPPTTSIAALASVSPRLQGPRSPVAKIQGTVSVSHRTRIVSGGGRRVSIGRLTTPLKGEENDPVPRSSPSIYVAGKRQHSEDQLQPRKRSLSRSPLESIVVDSYQILPDPPKVPLISQRTGSKVSPSNNTPRRSSGPVTTLRVTSSASALIANAVVDIHSNDPVNKDSRDLAGAIEAARQRVCHTEDNELIFHRLS